MNEQRHPTLQERLSQIASEHNARMKQAAEQHENTRTSIAKATDDLTAKAIDEHRDACLRLAGVRLQAIIDDPSLTEPDRHKALYEAISDLAQAEAQR